MTSVYVSSTLLNAIFYNENKNYADTTGVLMSRVKWFETLRTRLRLLAQNNRYIDKIKAIEIDYKSRLCLESTIISSDLLCEVEVISANWPYVLLRLM